MHTVAVAAAAAVSFANAYQLGARHLNSDASFATNLVGCRPAGRRVRVLFISFSGCASSFVVDFAVHTYYDRRGHIDADTELHISPLFLFFVHL